GRLAALRQVHTDVQLGDRGLQAERVEAAQVVLRGAREAVPRAQMPLYGEAVHGHALFEQVLDDGVVGVARGVDALDVVVVEEECGLRVGLVRPAEGVGDDARSQFADPDVVLGAQVALVAEDLVGDVPLLDPAGVTADDGGDVLTQDGAQLRLGEDRKSTRLNSSHVKISYAVFCLKKKKNKNA